MLNREQAQEELKKLEKKDWATQRVAGTAKLPDALRETARTILDAENPRGARLRGSVAAQQNEVIKTFTKMDETARLQFFEAMAPGLEKTIERGWRLFDRLPYQSGYLRKPFRSPRHPITSIGRRIGWFLQLMQIIGPYQKDVAWFAAWAPHLSNYFAADQLGILFAAAMDAGDAEGEEVFQILCASGRNEHEIGAMGRHVTRALLSASRPDGWQFVENMLLAAQREEGLRQAILETADESHPEAFRRMLRLILEHNLSRFSATVRALDVWLGYQWDAVSSGVVNATIEKILLYLEDASAREAALKGKDAEQVYLALWSHAFDDAVAVVAPATEMLKHSSAEHRFVAAHLLEQLGLVTSQKSLLNALEDADLSVTVPALREFQGGADERVIKTDLFERLEKLVSRYPDKPEKLKPKVWPWTNYTVSKQMVADALPHNLGERPATRLIEHLDQMGPHSRVAVMGTLAGHEKWDAATRDTLFALVGDGNRQVREAALRHLAKCEATPAEAEGIEKLLDRKTGDLRRGSLTLLSRQKDADALRSADRLMAAKSQPQRLAGLELLRLLVEQKRCAAEARACVEAYSSAHPKTNEAEQLHINMVLGADAEVPKLENALGLIAHADRSWPSAPVARKIELRSASSLKIIAALEQIFKDNAQQIVTVKKRDGEVWKGLLSDIEHWFPYPNAKVSVAEDRENLPLADMWQKWWETRGPEFRDADGMELLRAIALFHFSGQRFGFGQNLVNQYPEAAKVIFGDLPKGGGKKEWRVRNILDWLVRLHPPGNGAEFALNAAEAAFALVPKQLLQMSPAEAAKLKELGGDDEGIVIRDWQKMSQRNELLQSKSNWRRTESAYGAWLKVAQELYDFAPQLWNPSLHLRHWKLLRWLDQPVRPIDTGSEGGLEISLCLPRDRAEFRYVCLAHCEGGSTDADVIEQLVGEREKGYYGRKQFRELHQLSARKIQPEYAGFDFAIPLMERCRKRILEIELNRGDTATAASALALSISSVEGVSNLIALLRKMGKRNFVRGWARDNQSMETVLSHLVRCSFPLKTETAADFSREAKAAGISEERLVELAVYAPQWADFVEQTLGWKMLTEAVWWIHAHTKGTDWTVDQEIRNLWEADMNSRTSLSAADLLEGGVDVAWFNRIIQTLGEKKWNTVYEAAKFASTGGGHARAKLFADAMLDEVSKRELTQRITKKRHQDAVRALGLLPLAEGNKRETDLLERYKVIQEFRRGSKQFGSQRQASEKRAAQIGQQNLARSAGYADPIRLEWAMEAKAVEDLSDGPIEVTVDDVKVSLGIDPWGEIELGVTKDGKTLADIPAKLKKNPKIAALRARKVELKRQASRIRPSLEQFMVRGDEFSGAELRELMQHPLLAPMLKNLVIIGDGIAGYPVHDGKALENHASKVEAIKSAEKLRIAHPHDLLPVAEWHRWQTDCFARERIQPFKQVFRELYPLTQTEKDEGKQTRRYAGHQVQPRQALALLGQRGWVHHPEEGVRKIFHESGLVAWLNFQEGFFTPAEIEGLTLEGVFFTKRGEQEPIKLEQLPPRLFSETMRDLDLVVSVAHRGGIDPEASASTIEMRATLVQETMRLLKLGNVQVKDRYALIKGQLGEYSVHLGSAMTRKMPGESIFIVAVHSQHRGRLFLPFADNDPRTAEVMSKVLLLSRDNEIKDPNILDQIRRS